ncbi:MAG: hypothetical protein ACRDS0_15215 [Pseudonocardiaceae bacterium]
MLTVPTEVTDRMLIFGEWHLRTVLAEYLCHYNGRRPHRALHHQPPRPDHPSADTPTERIKCRFVLGGRIQGIRTSCLKDQANLSGPVLAPRRVSQPRIATASSAGRPPRATDPTAASWPYSSDGRPIDRLARG